VARRVQPARLTWAALGALLVAAFALVYLEGRGTSFFFDEWDFILHSRGNTASAFLTPHNGHLSLVPIAIYRLLFGLVGLHHYGAYRLAAAALHLVVGVLVFVLVRRRAGDGVALVGSGLVLFLGHAWQDLIWPFQIGYLASLAAGLGALSMLDRNDRPGDLSASVLVLIAYASSGLGIPLALGAGLAILISRSALTRLWVVVAPSILYGVWYLHYGQDQASRSNVTAVPGYVLDSFGGAVGALTGLGSLVRRQEAAVALILLLVAILFVRPDRRILVPIVIAVSFWALAALSRAQLHEPTASRYLYPGAIMLVLVIGELLHGVQAPKGVLIALAALAAVAAGWNVAALQDGANGLRAVDQTVDAELRALELERGAAASDLQPDPSRAPQLTAGPYFSAVDTLGSPAVPLADLPRLPPDVRSSVDAVMANAAPPSVVALAGSTSSRRCGHPTRGPLEIVVPARGLIVIGRAPVTLDLRRYGDPGSKAFSARLKAGGVRVTLQHDAAPVPWRATLDSRAPFLVC
jgi:hypothetical protein